MNIGELTATLGIDAAGLADAKRKMDQFEKDMDKRTKSINRSLESTGEAMKKVGKNMSLFITAPLAAVGAAAFKMQKDFEFSMTKIVGLVGVAQKQVDQWSKDIIKLAPQLGKAPKELADALFFVTSAGIKGAEAMDVLQVSAKAAAAGLGETKIVADLVTSAMNAYGAANLNATQATDILVAAVREGKAEANTLAQSMGQVLPIASQMGVTFDQVGAAIASMTRTGTEAATASIQLRQILASMLKPTKEAEDALEGMGTSSRELRKTIREDGLIAVLDKLRVLSNKYGEEIMATVFPNIRALSGVFDIMGSNVMDNIAIFDSLKDSTGALNTAFETVSETTEFKYQQAISASKAALTELGITIKSSAIPLLEKISEILQTATNWFRNLSESQKQTIIRVAALSAALGPLTIGLGFLAGNVLPNMIRGINFTVKAFNALRIAMLNNPFTAVATALAALITVVITFRKRTNEAADAQKILNDELERTDKIAGKKVYTEFLKGLGLIEKTSEGTLIKNSNTVQQLLRNVNKFSEQELRFLSEFFTDTIVNIERAGLQGVKTFNEVTGRFEGIEVFKKSLKVVENELARIQRLKAEAPQVDLLGDVDTVRERTEEIQEIQSLYFEGLQNNIASTTELARKSAKEEEEIARRVAQFKIMMLEQEFQKRMQISEATRTIMNATTDVILSLTNREFENTRLKFDQQIAAREKMGEDTTRLEQEKAKKLAEIERKAAIAERAARIFNIVLDTIQAVNKISLTQAVLLANPVTAPLAVNAGIQKGIAIARGVLSTSAVLAEQLPQIPQFFTGTKDAPGGAAILHAGEIVNALGGSYLVPGSNNEPYLIPDLPKHSEVIPKSDVNLANEESTMRIVDAINNRPEWRPDPRGLLITVKKGISKKEFIDTRYRV